MKIQYESPLFRKGHLAKLVATVCFAALALLGCVLTALLGISPIWYGAFGLILGGAVGIFFWLLHEIEWYELYPDKLVIRGGRRVVTEVNFASVTALEMRVYRGKEWFVLRDERPLRYRIHGKRGMNHPKVCVRVPATDESRAFFSAIPWGDVSKETLPANLRKSVVNNWLHSQRESFVHSELYRNLCDTASRCGIYVKESVSISRPSPTIAYEGGIAVSLFYEDGTPVLFHDAPLSIFGELVWGDATGHLSLTAWEHSGDFCQKLALIEALLPPLKS